MTEIETLRASLPPIFARSEIGRLTGGIIQPGTMRNRDSRGDGIDNPVTGNFAFFGVFEYSDPDNVFAWAQANGDTPLAIEAEGPRAGFPVNSHCDRDHKGRIKWLIILIKFLFALFRIVLLQCSIIQLSPSGLSASYSTSQLPSVQYATIFEGN